MIAHQVHSHVSPCSKQVNRFWKCGELRNDSQLLFVNHGGFASIQLPYEVEALHVLLNVIKTAEENDEVHATEATARIYKAGNTLGAFALSCFRILVGLFQTNPHACMVQRIVLYQILCVS
jgi:hypothetical protein